MRTEGYLFIVIENFDAEGLECRSATGAEMSGPDPRCGKYAGFDDSPGDALRHFAGSDEPNLVRIARNRNYRSHRHPHRPTVLSG
ncbi:hypothetical protein U1Q18_013002 [Sarracenia purpurea var. burkii]